MATPFGMKRGHRAFISVSLGSLSLPLVADNGRENGKVGGQGKRGKISGNRTAIELSNVAAANY